MGVQIYKGGFDLKIIPDNFIVYADLLEIPHQNGITLSKKGVQANPLCIRHCRSQSCI